MKTCYITINKDNPYNEHTKLQEISKFLTMGELVACPTETVYGLCGNALLGSSVKKIYEAKGRPSDNPLIIHISNLEMLNKLVQEVPKNAQKLIDAFWPGPLTIIFKKKDIVPFETTGGLDTVAIRMPNNKVILSIIDECNLPLSAPSANVSGRPSPTKAEHVKEDLDGKIACIVDGGNCDFGVESTIVDCTSEIPILLRPGNITVSMLENVLGKINIDKTITSETKLNIAPKAPGMKYKHYSPNAEVFLFVGDINEISNKIIENVKSHNGNVGILCTDETFEKYKNINAKVLSLGTRKNLNTITANLFSSLREMDLLGVDTIFCESFSKEDEGLAIMNRLIKASGYKIINI